MRFSKLSSGLYPARLQSRILLVDNGSHARVDYLNLEQVTVSERMYRHDSNKVSILSGAGWCGMIGTMYRRGWAQGGAKTIRAVTSYDNIGRTATYGMRILTANVTISCKLTRIPMIELAGEYAP